MIKTLYLLNLIEKTIKNYNDSMSYLEKTTFVIIKYKKDIQDYIVVLEFCDKQHYKVYKDKNIANSRKIGDAIYNYYLEIDKYLKIIEDILLTEKLISVDFSTGSKLYSFY